MNQPIPTRTGTREQLMSDLKSVLQDAEHWLRNGSQLTGEELAAAKARIQARLANVKDDLVQFEQAVVERTKEAARATDDYVHENPWKAVGIGALAGLLLGVIIARR